MRRASFRWPPRGQALKEARIRQIENPKTGRICWTYRCAGCKLELFAKETKIDHIEPVVPIVSGVQEADVSIRASALHLGSYVRRMLCEPQGFQVLCRPCHDIKTKRENEARRIARKAEQYDF